MLHTVQYRRSPAIPDQASEPKLSHVIAALADLFFSIFVFASFDEALTENPCFPEPGRKDAPLPAGYSETRGLVLFVIDGSHVCFHLYFRMNNSE